MNEHTVPGPGPTAPKREHRGTVIARRMRKLTGVREVLLDKIPAERTRYTALAAVMLCTASVGGFSMVFLLSEIMGRAEIWFLFLAVFWTVFVLCIDCWLVSSTAGTRWRTRLSVLLPRLAIAAVFGIVIAEPLVLRVFQTGIVDHVEQVRQNAIDNLRTALVACNPVPGLAEPPHMPHVGCVGKILYVANPAAASVAHLHEREGVQAALASQTKTENRQIHRLETTVNDECNGVSGPGLTGLVGNGPACQQDQGYLINYNATHPVLRQTARLARIGQQITSLQQGLAGQQARYRIAISAAIANRLKAETQPGAPIGMAERFQALTYLSLTNAFIGVASWFVRVFFILIDCLPVLVKFIGGSTPYDRLVDTEIASAQKRFARKTDTLDTIAEEGNITLLRKANAEASQERKEIDLQILRHDTAHKTDKNDAIDELWEKKLKARQSAGAGAGDAALHSVSSWSRHDPTATYTNGSSATSGSLPETTE
jgi:hypothetical protein